MMMKRLLTLLAYCGTPALLLASCGSSTSSESAPKACDFESTFEAIQATVFEAKGCASGACHGEAKLGGLDLRVGASHDSLVRIPSQIDPSIQRVFPGDEARSLLYRKLAETDESLRGDGLGGPMPANDETLSEDQLRALRLWIRGGAPKDTIVGATLGLLGCSGNFDPDPNKIDPLPPPAPGEGVQLYAGGWPLAAESEDEVCFATYYDFTESVPDQYRVACDQFGEGRECFAFRRNELAQDGQSHHSIITVYTPESDPNGDDWGPWTCLGGDRDGEACDPTNTDACGDRSQCATPATTSAGCVLYPYAPTDFYDFGATAVGGTSGNRVQLSGAQESTFIDEPQVGVYSLLPLTGFVGWNSHAFNLTKKGTTIEQWVNLTFAPEAERKWLRQQIFEAGEIFAMSTVAPFTKREVCMTFELPQHARLMTLSSHMHQRGEVFRIWLPPNEPCSGSGDCEPPAREADYVSRLYDDPLYNYYEPPLAYDGDDEVSRTFKACAVYDNGADNPFEVKRESTKPNSATCDIPFLPAYCGCEPEARACLGGDDQGAPCGGDDNLCGEGGICDACPLYGGITTDDEMFIPLGSYFVQSP